MRSKVIREGALGLLILAGIGVFGGILLWLRGFRTGEDGFTFTVKLPNASGLIVGSPVRFRGVQVGKVQSLQAETSGVNVVIAVDNAKLAIPRKSIVETNQSGFLASTSVDIFPQVTVATAPMTDPLNANCDNQVVICRNGAIDGQTGVNFTELLRGTTAVFRKLEDSEILDTLKKTLKATGEAAESIKKLSDSTNKVVGRVEKQFGQFSNTANAISLAASDIGKAASNADKLILENKEKLAQTLDGISAASKEARSLLAGAKPLLSDGKFITNLQVLSENAAQTAANLRQLSNEINNPATITTLRETLDSARATFSNAQKITADLDELTGDPKFRSNVRSLVNGLSGLVSSGSSLVLPASVPSIPSSPATVAKSKPADRELANRKIDDSDPIKLKLSPKKSEAEVFEQKINNAPPATTQVPATRPEIDGQH